MNIRQEIAHLELAEEFCRNANLDTAAQAVERAIDRLRSIEHDPSCIGGDKGPCNCHVALGSSVEFLSSRYEYWLKEATKARGKLHAALGRDSAS